MLEYQDAGFAVSYEERLWCGARWELVSGLWPVTSAGRIDQIQLTAMRETLVTARICPLSQFSLLFQRWTSESHVFSKKINSWWVFDETNLSCYSKYKLWDNCFIYCKLKYTPGSAAMRTAQDPWPEQDGGVKTPPSHWLKLHSLLTKECH